MFPQYYERREAGDYLPSAGTPQKQRRRVLPEGFGVVCYRPAGAEFITLQLAAILTAAIVTLAMGESFGFLYIMGIAGIAFVCFVVAVRMVEALRRRVFNRGSAVAPVGSGVAIHERELWWAARARNACAVLTSLVVGFYVHSLISQLGALFLVAVVLADITMLIHRARS